MVGKMPMLAIAVILVMGIYVLPSVTAKFSGSHTMEFNKSGVTGLLCMECHTYIEDELLATTSSQSVLQAHRNAAGNADYANESNASADLSIDPDNSTIAGACQICHLMESTATNIGGTHTKVTIRACTDKDCHGNSSTTGTTAYTGAGAVGGKLSNNSDAHSGFFGAMKNAGDSSYPNEDGGYYSKGFYACLACHTHLEMNMNLSRPQAFNINMTMNSTTNEFDIEGPVINYTNMNLSSAQREKGSVWS